MVAGRTGEEAVRMMAGRTDEQTVMTAAGIFGEQVVSGGRNWRTGSKWQPELENRC
jgi:hypothetical protein